MNLYFQNGIRAMHYEKRLYEIQDSPLEIMLYCIMFFVVGELTWFLIKCGSLFKVVDSVISIIVR